MNIKIVAGKTKESIFEAIFFAAAAFSIIAVLLICLFLFVNGIPAMKKIGVFDFIFGLKWKPGSDLYGIFPMIVGKLAGGVFGIFVAIMMMPKNINDAVVVDEEIEEVSEVVEEVLVTSDNV